MASVIFLFLQEKLFCLWSNPGLKQLEKKTLKSGVAFTSNVLAGKNVKQVVLQRTKQAGSTLLRHAQNKFESAKKETLKV